MSDHHHSKRNEDESTACGHPIPSNEAACDSNSVIHRLGHPETMGYGHPVKQPTATDEVILTFSDPRPRHGHAVKQHILTPKVVGQPKIRIHALTPPLGTMFFGHRQYTIWDLPIQDHNKKTWVHIRWAVEAYTYASSADPRSSDFAQQGGKIHVVLVTRGYFEVANGVSSDIWNQLTLAINPNGTGLEPVSQLPATGSGIQQGDDYQYMIDFEQSLPMFKNQGNEAFTFDAKYKESFGLTLAKQLGSRGKIIELGIETTKDSSAHRYTELYGVSVFTHTNPRAFPLQLDRRAAGKGTISWSASGKWDLELGFDLE